MHGSTEREPEAITRRKKVAARAGFVAIVLLSLLLHVEFASMKTRGLLEHDESISLLAAAGKSDRMADLDAGSDRVRIMRASDLQALMRPTGDTGFADVWRSVVDFDVHPPLYFWLLHGLERVGITSLTLLRLVGFVVMLAAAIVADRWIWPNASLWARLPAFGMLIAAPPWVDLATELRQYALVFLGTTLTIAALAKSDRGEKTGSASAMLIIAGVLLIWTHLGSVAWVLIALLIAIRLTWRRSERRALPMVAVACAIGFLVLPLVVANWNPVVVGRVGASQLSPSAAFERGAMMTRSIAESFVFIPVRPDGSAIGLTGTRFDQWLPPGIAVVTLLVLAGVAISLARSTRRLEKALIAGGFIWSLAWLVGLATGKIPEHATAPKYLAPMSLALLATVVRATDSKSKSLRYGVIGLLWIASTTWPLGWMVRMPSSGVASGREIGPILDAETLLVDRPKRGQMLPIINKLSPGATVIIATPEVAARNWNEVEAALPKDRLVVLEIDAYRAPPVVKKARDAEFEALRAGYGEEFEFRRGSGRRMTEYRNRREFAPN